MVWFKLDITGYKAEYSPLKVINSQNEDLKYCDEKGNELQYVKGSVQKGYYVNSKNEKVSNVFLLKNGKPFDKYEKTKIVKKIKEVDLKEVENLMTDKKYLMICKPLLEKLENTEKAIKFIFSNGGKEYSYAYVYASKLYNGFLFMELGKGYVSDSVKPLVEQLQEKEKADELNLAIQGVSKLNVDEIEL